MAPTSSRAAVPLRIDSGAGHVMGAARSQRHAMGAGIDSVLPWRAGLPAFKPLP